MSVVDGESGKACRTSIRSAKRVSMIGASRPNTVTETNNRVDKPALTMGSGTGSGYDDSESLSRTHSVVDWYRIRTQEPLVN